VLGPALGWHAHTHQPHRAVLSPLLSVSLLQTPRFPSPSPYWLRTRGGTGRAAADGGGGRDGGRAAISWDLRA
jgi:hypothetical protein